VLIVSPRDLRKNVEHGKDHEYAGDDDRPPVDTDSPEPIGLSLCFFSHPQMVTPPPTADKELTLGE
jgi:hypothetical protein